MADKICIFAGTTEGRKLTEMLKDKAEITACVATEYGEIAFSGIDGFTVRTGRMDINEMVEFFSEHHFDKIIDATHPYAQSVTENIAKAASTVGIPLIRVLREADRSIDNAVYVSSVSEAAGYLKEKDGNILITTGSKEISEYMCIDVSRVWARVLPVKSSLEACENAGIQSSHIIAAQGPFTEEINIAQLKMINAKYMVTKSSGKYGGFDEKINAAFATGTVPVIIGQPPQSKGLSFNKAIEELGRVYNLQKRKISLIGIGPGNPSAMTIEAKQALEMCDAVIGAKSVVDSLKIKKPCFYEYLPGKVKEVIENNLSLRNISVVLRGDTGFFSGAKKMINYLENEDVSVFPGVSSVSVLSARIGASWDDAKIVSLHGRNGNIVSVVKNNKKVFALTDKDNSPADICRKLCEYGFEKLKCAVGERLSYEEEKITKGSVLEISKGYFDSLAVLYIENPYAEMSYKFGIPDEKFVRGEVPMTKSEVRAISMAKLSLKSDSVIWDIGAGTGSVSVESAIFAYDGSVYAIEKEPEALELIKINGKKFKTDNICIISGYAPDVFDDLPTPTHAFIGGSGGKLNMIIEALLNRNPDVRIVINTVTLESQAEAVACADKYGFSDFEAVSVNISRTRKAGSYHLMSAQNPVTVFVMQGEQLND